MGYVYWITNDVNLDIRTSGYVGVTKNNIEKRIKSFTQLNYWTIDSMIRKFRLGWKPNEDESWLKYKESENENNW